jgi:DNA (cytosine-5)-methyltransferase 1
MKYGSVCSGIEAATMAWHHMGWQPQFFSEIEAFPAAVLEHHYPNVPNLGDMTKFKEWPDYELDLLVGGTPCQSFSVAGLRKGLSDPRGNLALTFLAIADRYRPQYVVWENVPGVLSSGRGRDFGSFLGALAELGYGWAYRVLDAQYFGVAQRRRRVFVVGCLGGAERAAAVLFERESLSGNPAPSREKGQGIAGGVTHSLRGEGFDASEDGTGRGTPLVPMTFSGNQQTDVAGTLETTCHDYSRADSFNCVAFAQNQRGELSTSETVGALSSGGGKPGQGYPAIAIQTANTGANGKNYSEEITQTLDRASPPAVALSFYGGNKRKDRPQGGFYVKENEPTSKTLDAASGLNPTCSQGGTAVMQDMAVRRLTPRECERLQGFPDDFTQIPYRNKPAAQCPGGPRYKALGNSMAVPVMRWIGEGIDDLSLAPDCGSWEEFTRFFA